MILHTKYRGPRPFDFRQEDFFHIFPILAYVKHLTPEDGVQGYNLYKLGRDHAI